MVKGDGGEPDLEGVPPEMAEQIRADLAARAESLEVWPDNHEAVRIFRRALTQWRTSFSGVIGLDYTALDLVMRWHEVADPADCFTRVQVMEDAALAAIHEKR